MEDPKPPTEIRGSPLAQQPSVPFDFCAPNGRPVRHRLFLPRRAGEPDPRLPLKHALPLQLHLAAAVPRPLAIHLGRMYPLRTRIEARPRTPSASWAGTVKNELPSRLP